MSDDLWAVIAAADLCTLATIKRDGRPQLSDVNYTADDKTRVLRVSTRETLAKVHNLRRDPRGSLRVAGPGGAGYVAAEVTATFSEPSAEEHDTTVEELIEVYRLIRKEEHPDWDDYRIVLSLRVERLYGWVM
jgi:PPOX class probable F420-dependent enzyme